MQKTHAMPLIGLLAITWQAAIVAAEDPLAQDKSPRTALDIRISPAVDLYYHVRTLAEDKDASADAGPFKPAVDAVRELGDALGGGFLKWGPIEGTLVDCQTASDIRASFGQLPETFNMRFPPPGRTVQMRDPAVKLADALVAVEPHFLSSVWPEHHTALQAMKQRIDKELLPKQSECLAFMLEHLGMQDPHATIPVYLLVDAPFPGAFTFRTRGGGSVCMARSRGYEGSILYESILHEATHALDIAAGGESVLGDLRRRLQEAGITRRDDALRDVPHTLMFVHAGETVRRHLNPDHIHYGDAAGYYPKVPRATAAIRPNWTQYLDNDLTRDQALAAIVADFMAAAP